jgi:transcriptional activator of cad operon
MLLSTGSKTNNDWGAGAEHYESGTNGSTAVQAEVCKLWVLRDCRQGPATLRMIWAIPNMPLVRLGDWILDPSDGTLASPLERKHLEPKVQAVLLLLIDRRGTVVSQEEIFNDVWRDTHVAPTALARTISMLRQALEDDVRKPRYIETVPKRGYRLIASVEPVSAPDAPSDQFEVERPTRSARIVRHAVAVAATIALAIAAGHDEQPMRPQSHDMEAVKRRLGIFHDRLWHDTRLGNETAFEYYTRELTRHPASVDALAGLAMVYAFRSGYLPDQAHWLDAALDTARRASEMDPSNLPAAKALAIAQLHADHLQDAIGGFERALQLSPDDQPSRTNLGQTLARTGHFHAALGVFEEQLAAEPQWVWGYAYASSALASGGYLDEAVRVAEAGIEREPFLLEAHLTLVRAELLQGRYESARARLRRLLDAQPDCAPCVVQLGVVEQVLGRADEARRHYETARAMPPAAAMASLRLAHLRSLEHDRAGAETLLREVEDGARAQLDRGVDSPQPRWLLAAASAVRGDHTTALLWYARAIEAGRRDVTWDAWEPLFSAIQPTADFKKLSERIHADQRTAAPLVARILSHLAPGPLALR